MVLRDGSSSAVLQTGAPAGEVQVSEYEAELLLEARRKPEWRSTRRGSDRRYAYRAKPQNKRFTMEEITVHKGPTARSFTKSSSITCRVDDYLR
jgi:hypothetical protein